MTIDVILYVWGDNLDIEELTSVLGYESDQLKLHITSRNSGHLASDKSSMWCCAVSRPLANGAASTLLEELLRGRDAILCNLKERGVLSKIRVTVIISLDNSSDEVLSWEDEISSHAVQMIASFGASITITVLR